MFEEWKRVWREAVENFQQELGEEGEATPGTRHSAMRRDLAAARHELKRIEGELAKALQLAQAERENEQACMRRKTLAEKISDEETIRVAAAFAEKHAARAVILERKVEVFQAELVMRTQDLQDMEGVLSEYELTATETTADLHAGSNNAVDDDVPSANKSSSSTTRTPAGEEDEFVMRKMQREARERAAEARLEELKKRMR